MVLSFFYFPLTLVQPSAQVIVFNISEPLAFTKYLKFEFLSHAGSEFYCPLRLVG